MEKPQWTIPEVLGCDAEEVDQIGVSFQDRMRGRLNGLKERKRLFLERQAGNSDSNEVSAVPRSLSIPSSAPFDYSPTLPPIVAPINDPIDFSSLSEASSSAPLQVSRDACPASFRSTRPAPSTNKRKSTPRFVHSARAVSSPTPIEEATPEEEGEKVEVVKVAPPAPRASDDEDFIALPLQGPRPFKERPPAAPHNFGGPREVLAPWAVEGSKTEQANTLTL